MKSSGFSTKIRMDNLTLYVLLSLKAIIILVIIKSFFIIKDNNNLNNELNNLQLNMLNIQQSLTNIVMNSMPEHTKINQTDNQVTISLTSVGAAHGIIKDCFGNSMTEPTIFNNVLSFGTKITCETKYHDGTTALAVLGNNINHTAVKPIYVNNASTSKGSSYNTSIAGESMSNASTSKGSSSNASIPAALNFNIILSSEHEVYSKPQDFSIDIGDNKLIELKDKFYHALFNVIAVF